MLNKFFIYLLIFSFISGQLIRLDIFGYAFPLLDAAVFVFMIYKIISHKFSLKQYFSQKYLLIFIGALLFSNLINVSKYTLQENITGNLYLIRFVMYSLILGIKEKEQTVNHAKKNVILIGTIIALIGLTQLFLLPDLRFLQWQNWDDHLNRLTFPYLDPSFTGAILLIFLIYLFFLEQPRLLLSFLFLISLLFTFSRAAWITGGILLVIFFFKTQKNKKLSFWIMGGIGAIGIILFFFSRDNFTSYGNKIWRKETVISRISSLNKGVKIWQKNPLFGVGFNHYKTYQLKNNYYVKNLRENRGEASVENSYVFVLATSGIVGESVFVLWLWTIISKLKGSTWYIFLSILIGSLFNNIFFYPHVLLITFIIISCFVGDDFYIVPKPKMGQK